ncbi:MAG: dihydrolipoyl dehydrogenase [Alistipes senegalensis]|nr:dihydrolipoyl dehydrogenase [Oxalobacter formigenes]MCM1280984.1 dihydrolipoyl dehydrogenase [Alistipes senegalensis]
MSILFDVGVIGAGPGGYSAAIRAAQLGLNVACIDKWSRYTGEAAPGGTCGNVGCIPSKALLDSSAHFDMIRNRADLHGIEVKGVALNLNRMMGRKDEIVAKTNEGILFLFRKNGVSFYHGTAAFEEKVPEGYRLKITGREEQYLICRHIIIATGSLPRPFPGLAFDEKRVLSNTGALAMESVPQRLGIIGAGIVGLELGSVWHRLGANVTLLESQPALLGAADRQIASEALKYLRSGGLDIRTNVGVQTVQPDADGVLVEYDDADGTRRKMFFDRLIVAIGRVPYTSGLGADRIGLELDQQGFIVVDSQCRTNLPNVWAIGDVVRGPMLAHKAQEEGVAVADRIAGKYGAVDYTMIPSVVYTHPEIAWVGKTEQELEAAGCEFCAGTFPFRANGRARAMNDTEGWIKILSDAYTDEVLGVHMIGPLVSELMAEVMLAMTFRASSEDISRICHAHPTLSETVREAAMAAHGRCLNY